MSKPFFTVIACALLLNGGSCRKITIKTPYTLKGRILKDCSGVPLSGWRLNVTFRKSRAFRLGVETINAGTVITGPDGDFAITCQDVAEEIRLHGMTKDSGFYWTVRDNIGVEDLGNLYQTLAYCGVARIRVLGNYSANDTIYAGISPLDMRRILPSPDGQVEVFHYETSGENPPYATNPRQRLVWGIGKRGFDSAYNNVQSPSGGTPAPELLLRLCACSDTTLVIIP